MSWNDAIAFCEWLKRKEGRNYGLPTEAQWEYACRAGTRSLYQHGNDPEELARAGNVADGTYKAKFSSSKAIRARDNYIYTAPVGQFAKNAFGLYGMQRNVFEWCADWYDKNYYAGSPSSDPTGPLSSPEGYRVYRGGSWLTPPYNCRSALRHGDNPGNRFNFIGFRVVLPPAGSP